MSEAFQARKNCLALKKFRSISRCYNQPGHLVCGFSLLHAPRVLLQISVLDELFGRYDAALLGPRTGGVI